ncbi:transglycosylase SLT domain-containing protein [Candidatus Albibeggiatoa sp. nov. NOAA]|uniref:transglycosylase SLT domain-containing protein n=1 Tax=Candidatus Albibeggiatoa sp. nov. NOAA TaxID=3162724 RepID=UPI003301AA86|nr:transglycosylase SLT domain-containing protein [Thiotrichaceae bacterium]
MNIRNALTFIICSLCLAGCNTLAPKSTPEMVTSFAAQSSHAVADTTTEIEKLATTQNENAQPDQLVQHSFSEAESKAVAVSGDAWLFPYKLEAQTPLIFRDVLTTYHFPSAAEIEQSIAEKEAQKKAAQLAKLEAERSKPVEVKVNVRGNKKHKRYKGKSKNLWTRIRNGYSLTHVSHPRIDAAIKRYTKSPYYFPKISKQAKPYLYHIVQEIEKRGLPLELALLPAIESAYEPSAYSHMRAAGIWQFTPGTAKHFGLKHNVWYDERRDIITSTDAALDYLKYLHKFFDGDWLLAIGAYNCGEGNMRKAIKRNKRAGKPTDFWSLNLPKETKAFVPKILGVARVVVNPKKYGVNVNYIPNTPYLQTVEIDQQIDLSVAAKFAGLSAHEFKRLNPGYRRRATGPDGPFQLALPVNKVASFKRKLKKVTMKDLMPNPELAKLELKVGKSKRTSKKVAKKSNAKKRIHTVRSGDSLWEIARKYRVTVSKLTRWNNISKRQTLRLGQKLTIWQGS